MIRRLVVTVVTGIGATLAPATAASAAPPAVNSFDHEYGQFGNYATEFKVVNYGDRAEVNALAYTNAMVSMTTCWTDIVSGKKGAGKVARKLGMMRETSSDDFTKRRTVNLGKGTYRVRVMCETVAGDHGYDHVFMYSKAFRLVN